MPSNDPCTAAVAILRTMAELEPEHPVTRSLSAVYWHGGGGAIESPLLRAQFFDKIAAWGGDAALRQVKRYIGPGLELVAFNPAADTTLINQDACASSRFHLRVSHKAATEVPRCHLLITDGRHRGPLSGGWGDSPAGPPDSVREIGRFALANARIGDLVRPLRTGLPNLAASWL
jgi:Acyl-CoA reductase (LuxC)